jgi:hypothetical protein
MDKKQITATVLLSLFTTIAGIGLWSGIVSTQQDINTKNIKCLQVDLASEREERKDEFTEILVALSSLDTKVSILMENRNNDKD